MKKRRRSGAKTLTPVDNRGGWTTIMESFPGAWQANTEVTVEDGLSYWAVVRCINIISSDIAKMELRLMQKDADGIKQEVESPAFSPVLRKPNYYQNIIQFFEHWMNSKLMRGNTYVLMERDNRDVVIAFYILDPTCVTPMVNPASKLIFYQLQREDLPGLEKPVMVPASEIIHDRMNARKGLVGFSPLHSVAIAAMLGKKIQNNSTNFFANGSLPGGILTAPGLISDETAKRLKDHWEANYTGTNVGKIAVLGDGLKFEGMRMTSEDAQLIEQLKWNDAIICGAFGVPAYMLNAGSLPAYNNVQQLTMQYYSQCLQIHIENIEKCLDEGLGLREAGYETEFDLDDLLRMDSATQITSIKDAVTGGVLAPNEGRLKLGYGPKEGGENIFLQQQMEPVSVRAKPPQPTIQPQPQPQPQPEPSNDNAAAAFMAMRKEFQNA